MVISAISAFNGNLKCFNNFKTRPSFGYHSVPQFQGLASDVFVRSNNISFTGADEKVMRDLGHINCPCCGVKMITGKDLGTIHGNKKLAGSSKIAVEFLSKYEENMRPIEKKVFEAVKEQSAKTPEKDLRQILLGMKRKHFNKLKLIELKTLDKIDNLSENVSDDTALELRRLTTLTRQIIIDNNSEKPFKRKAFIQDLQQFEDKIEDKKVFNKMMMLAKKLPTSHDNMSAFVVKYAERTPKEIGERLVSTSLGTIEHVKPQSLRGPSRASNYILECAGCNNPRGNTDLDVWIKKTHPEMPENCQKYIDVVIEKINNGGMQGYETYPIEIKKTLKEQSKGLIDLDISKLEISEEALELEQARKALAEKYGKNKK